MRICGARLEALDKGECRVEPQYGAWRRENRGFSHLARARDRVWRWFTRGMIEGGGFQRNLRDGERRELAIFDDGSRGTDGS
ncbi:UNVERIFIED_CONTAM: hypothetical protein Sangu_2415700 [Sesamum angustifolium]|uniref:Uncharacterized protein n=1 Tax=Sesamum angustifolium TaxID=2727405 RepID=A0AAW2KW96_9LAMI